MSKYLKYINNCDSLVYNVKHSYLSALVFLANDACISLLASEQDKKRICLNLHLEFSQVQSFFFKVLIL